jgi:hypothetical protein
VLLDKIPLSRRIDIGDRAGVTAGLLGVLCVLAELCFLFPNFLVSNDARGFYAEHIQIFRGILHVAIILTFALGALSVLILRSRGAGLLGVALAMVATLLGGSRAEPITATPREFSAGLDYFILELLVLALLFIQLAYPFKRQRETPYG